MPCSNAALLPPSIKHVGDNRVTYCHSYSRYFCFLCHRARRFVFQQRLLPLQPPTVTCKFAISPHHPMARHYHRDWIRRARPRHRPHRSWLSNRSRHLAIRAGGSVRNPAKLLPHTALQLTGLPIGRQVKVWVAPPQMLHNLPHPSLKAIATTPSLRPWVFLL